MGWARDMLPYSGRCFFLLLHGETLCVYYSVPGKRLKQPCPNNNQLIDAANVKVRNAVAQRVSTDAFHTTTTQGTLIKHQVPRPP